MTTNVMVDDDKLLSSIDFPAVGNFAIETWRAG
jgi:hypothetical protein